jgi:bifunctional NMN adenylyltransferase/nudix hydrolase
MSKEKFDYSVFIGKFGPVHGYISDDPTTINGHVKVMVEALDASDFLIVVVGSANAAINTRIPFTAEERIEMIKVAVKDDPRILYTTADDHPYDDNKWAAGIQAAVDKTIEANELKKPNHSYVGWRDYKYGIALAGMYKDDTSYYLNMFPQWSNAIAIAPGTYEGEVLSSTGIRNEIFNGSIAHNRTVHPAIRKHIEDDMSANPEKWDRLKSDWKYEQQYESLWGKGPHVTVDSLVVQAGHVLLIQRGNEYGHKQWALPGGFVNRREKLVNAALRELDEETRLKVPKKVLKGSITNVTVYDDPFRSNRSRIITHVFKIVLENVNAGLPEVYGSDDAEKAKWVPIAALKELRGQFFEDHGAILQQELGITF